MPANIPLSRLTRFGLAAMLVAGVGLATGLNAQEQGAAPNQPQTVTLDELSESKVKAAAKAYQAVIDISQKYEQKFADVGDDVEKARNLQEEATDKMITAIKQADLTIEEYNTIIPSMRSDDDLRQAIQQHMEN
ncbi:MAG: DUF4168 domain-containing protein [Planctomycetota bacterium]